MGNPYIILSESIPPERTGVYMGIFNMMIVTPMLLNAVTMPLYFDSLLAGDPRRGVGTGRREEDQEDDDADPRHDEDHLQQPPDEYADHGFTEFAAWRADRARRGRHRPGH